MYTITVIYHRSNTLLYKHHVMLASIDLYGLDWLHSLGGYFPMFHKTTAYFRQALLISTSHINITQ